MCKCKTRILYNLKKCGGGLQGFSLWYTCQATFYELCSTQSRDSTDQHQTQNHREGKTLKKRLPIGIDNFKEIVDGNYYFIDKTLLIKELLDRGSKITLLPRPRRFGKTLNMHMIQCFFELPISRPYNLKAEPLTYLFRDKNIWTDEHAKSLQGTLPTIALTLKGIKATSWGECYTKIIDLIAAEYYAHHYLLEGNALSPAEKITFLAVENKQASQPDYENSLKYLSIYLQRHHQTKVLVLVDEYDAPIHAGYLNKFYQDATGFIRSLFEAVFKDNHALELGIITGILRTAKEGIFSGLNNLVVHSLLDEPFSDKFGFTQQEVSSLLATYDLSMHADDVKKWYDGYIINNVDGTTKQPINLYNPWALINFVANNARLVSYWANTSDNALIKKLLTTAPSSMQEQFELLLSGKEIELSISDGFVFPGIEKNEAAIWSLFLSSGYLTAAKSSVFGQWYTCKLKIPNMEIQQLFQDLTKEIFSESGTKQATDLLKALVSGDGKLFGLLLQHYIKETISYFDMPSTDIERSYHMLILGMLVHLKDSHQICSNRESGYGRYDVMIIPKDPSKLGIILEFKRTIEEFGETLENSAAAALVQIHEKSYATEMQARGIKHIIAYGVGLHGKQVLVKSEVVPMP